MSLFSAAIQELLQSALLQEIAALVESELGADPHVSLSALQATAQSKADELLSRAVGRFPKWEQPFLDLVLGLGESAVNSWVNGLVAIAYDKALADAVGTKNAASIEQTQQAAAAA